MADHNDDTTNKGKGNESDSKKTQPNTDAFDPKKLSDEDLNKVFDDPRIWEHKRFKELNESAKAGKEALAKLDKIEEEKLKAEGKNKELADKYKARAEEAEKALQGSKINSAIQAEAMKQGAVDLEAVLKLADTSKITIDEDTGAISGADEVVKGLLESKPYLKNANANNQPNIGSGTQPGTDTTGAKKFTLSQLQDPKFYSDNKDDILQAMKTGNVVDDMSPQQTPGPQTPQG